MPRPSRVLKDGDWVFRRQLAGTFQVSVLPVDSFAPFLFYTGSVLAAGAIQAVLEGDELVREARDALSPTMATVIGLEDYRGV